MLADRYDCFLLDLDGTLYRGDHPVPGAADAVSRLHRAGERVIFMTNNSGRTPEEIAAKLAGYGIEAEAKDVVTSALATADLLARRKVGSAFVIGGKGIRTALEDEGIELRDGEHSDVDCVIVGWDRTADYAKLKNAGLLVQRGAALIATNADNAFPAPDGLWPGAGALLSVITTTTGASAEIVGKPHAPLFRKALAEAGGRKPLVVGDRLDTDIGGAAGLGWDSLLVFTGIAQPPDLDSSDVHPTYAAADLSALFEEEEAVRRPR